MFTGCGIRGFGWGLVVFPCGGPTSLIFGLDQIFFKQVLWSLRPHSHDTEPAMSYHDIVQMHCDVPRHLHQDGSRSKLKQDTAVAR